MAEKKVSKPPETESVTPKGPIATPRKEIVSAHRALIDSFPWAINRPKLERAVKYVDDEIKRTRENISSAEHEQRVMDEYVLHGGLVRGQEKNTVVGRSNVADIDSDDSDDDLDTDD